MKTFVFGIVVLLFVVSVSSCNKDEKIYADDIYNIWEATDYISLESSYHSKIDNYSPVIEFKENGSFTLKLDRNNCTGNFTVSGENGIEITGPGCTKICCDSDFSNKIAVMLPQVKSYSIEGNRMKMYVPAWGWINLELK